MLLLLSLTFYACKYKPLNDVDENDKLKLDYGSVTLFQSSNGKILAYNLIKGDLKILGELPKNSEFLYNKDKKIWVFLLKKEDGKNLVHNEILAINGTENISINDFYSASDLRLSPKGNNIIFRNFKKDSFDSVGPIKIYNFSSKKEIEIGAKELISGNVYDFLGDNDICYYGLLPENGHKGTIYKYDIAESKESILFSSLKGYCTYLKGINSKGLFFLDKNSDNDTLNYYDLKNKSLTSISDNITDVFNCVYDIKCDEIYFIAKNSSSEISLYKYDISGETLNRLTYDFPGKVDVNGGLGISEEGIYFCGDFDSFNKVYLYDFKDKSINLVTDEETYYKVYSTN